MQYSGYVRIPLSLHEGFRLGEVCAVNVQEGFRYEDNSSQLKERFMSLDPSQPAGG